MGTTSLKTEKIQNEMPRGTYIHPTALVHPKAVIGEGSRIGAFSIIEEYVEIGRNCEIKEHVIIHDYSKLGDGVRVFPYAILGGEPQHTQYQGTPTRLEIGNHVIIREMVTANRGTDLGGGVTSIGDQTYIMANCHIAHDCKIGKHVVMANSVEMAGHVQIHDFVTVSGMVGIAQHCRIGKYCFIGGYSAIRKDVPPFTLGKDTDFHVFGINRIGLERNGFSESKITLIKNLYKIFYTKQLTTTQAIETAIHDLGQEEEVMEFIQFVQESKTGLSR